MAAPSIVQSKLAYSSGEVASLGLTFDSTPGVGRLIVVFVFADDGYPTVADNQSNTYTNRDQEGYGTDFVWGRLYTAPATTSSGSFTITATPAAGSDHLLLVAYEIASWNSSTLYEKLGHIWQTSGFSADMSPLNFDATTNAEQLFLACMCNRVAHEREFAASTGWTQDQLIGTGATNLHAGAISKQVTSTGTYDPEWDSSGGSSSWMALGISLVGGTEGPLSSGVDLAGSATAGATASATLAVQRNLAAAAVAGALASGTLSINRALTGAAIGAALGSATLTAFSSVWRIPTNAPNGTAVHATVFSGASPTYAILAQGAAVVAGGFVDIPGIGTIGAKAFAFVHNYNDNTATVNMRGGPAIATLTSL
jgi:hypothetical protein